MRGPEKITLHIIHHSRDFPAAGRAKYATWEVKPDKQAGSSKFNTGTLFRLTNSGNFVRSGWSDPIFWHLEALENRWRTTKANGKQRQWTDNIILVLWLQARVYWYLGKVPRGHKRRFGKRNENVGSANGPSGLAVGLFCWLYCDTDGGILPAEAIVVVGALLVVTAACVFVWVVDFVWMFN